MNTKKAIITGLGSLLVLGFAFVPAGAVHITGNDEDPVASTAVMATVRNNDWWASGEAATVCEQNANMGVPGAAGVGGRCFSHRYEENATDPGKKTKEPKTHVKSLDKDEWWRMQVTPAANTPDDCGSVINDKRVIGYFARMGNNDHGIQVEAGNDFNYRPKLAQIIDDNHITYFINLDETGALPVLCWGHDWHADATAPVAGAVDTKGRETACNDIKDDDYDALDPTTYDRDGAVEQTADRWNTVCTAPNPNS